jgi:uncharacterized SAM-binding protein YcdF (DUF218 family)
MSEAIDSAVPRFARARQVLAVGVFLCVLLLAYFGSVYYQVWNQANSDEARPADAIVVLGAAEYWGKPSPILKARLDHALELFNRQFAPRIITTGGHGLGSEFSEAAVAREYLSKHGVPAELISIEDAGESTMQSAAAVAEIMDRMKMTSCIVVSDGYHIHRIKNILEEQGIKVFGSPREPGDAGPWARGWLYARESLGYILWRFGIRV